MINIRTLDCGVRVITDRTDYLQSAAIGIWVKAGSVDEEDRYAGVSHFIEHMMFKGTKNRTAKQIADDMDKLGSQFNAFTSKEATCYYAKTISSNLIKSTEILLDMLTESLFDKHEMTRERQVICEEIKMTQDSPEENVHDMISEAVNRGNPLGRSIIGTPTSLKRISRNVLVDYIDKEYTRDSIVVAIAGNFDEDEICSFLEGRLKRFSPTKEKKNHQIIPYTPAFRTKVKDIEQAHFFLGTESVTMTDDEYYAVTVLGNILGGSMSSRLFQSVRETKGLAYSVYSFNASASMAGAFYIYAGVSHDNLRKAIEAVKEELLILGREGVTKEELSKAKEQLKANFIFGQENVASKMFSLGKSLILTDNVKTDSEVLEKIDSITMDEINKTAVKFADPLKYSAAAITNRRFDIKKVMQG